MDIQTCCVPECEEKRQSSHHCLKHHIKYNKIYQRYKKLQNGLSDIDIQKLTTEELKFTYCT